MTFILSQMKPEGSEISWSHFQNLYHKDRCLPIPKCPKLTIHHINLDNSSKMRVSLAT